MFFKHFSIICSYFYREANVPLDFTTYIIVKHNSELIPTIKRITRTHSNKLSRRYTESYPGGETPVLRCPLPSGFKS